MFLSTVGRYGVDVKPNQLLVAWYQTRWHFTMLAYIIRCGYGRAWVLVDGGAQHPSFATWTASSNEAAVV